MSKNTDALRRYGAGIKAEPQHATENTGVFIMALADEVDRLRERLDSVRVGVARALPFLRQACRTAHQTNDPENCQI